jgi:hypothetical protein
MMENHICRLLALVALLALVRPLLADPPLTRQQQQEEWNRWKREDAISQRPWVFSKFVEEAHRQAGPQGLRPPPSANFAQLQTVAGLLSSERRADPPPPAQAQESVQRCREKWAKLAEGVRYGYVLSQTGQFLRVVRPPDGNGRPQVTLGMLDEKNDDASLFQLLQPDQDGPYYLRNKLTSEFVGTESSKSGDRLYTLPPDSERHLWYCRLTPLADGRIFYLYHLHSGHWIGADLKGPDPSGSLRLRAGLPEKDARQSLQYRLVFHPLDLQKE